MNLDFFENHKKTLNILGSAGPKGSEGLQGPKGSNGTIGLTGNKGARGIKGNKGVIGPKGKPGLRGTKGNKGYRGEICASLQLFIYCYTSFVTSIKIKGNFL